MTTLEDLYDGVMELRGGGVEGNVNVVNTSADRSGIQDLELTAAIKTLGIKENAPGRSGMNDLLSKLEESRSVKAVEKRSARKAAWKAEAKEEVIKRQGFLKLNVLEVLHEVAWRCVLERVEEAKDMAQLSKMNLVWRDLLMKQRTTYLFHAVCPLLLEYEDFGHSSLTATKISILKRRLVSKEWKKSMDFTVQRRPHLASLPDIDENPYGPTVPCVLLAMEFPPINSSRIAEFLECADVCYPDNGNPFFSRKLRVGMVNVSCPPFWDLVEQLLAKWGHQVWQLYIMLDSGLDFSGVYNEICRFLVLVPNLKVLQINGNLGHIQCVWNNQTCKTFAALNRQIEDRPLPELRQLKTLSVICMPPPIIKEMLNRYNSTLENAIMGGVKVNPNTYSGDTTSFHHFKNVSICCGDFALPEGRFLGNHPVVEDLRLFYSGGLGKADPPTLFRSLNDFGSTLRKLVLRLHQQQDGPLTKLDAGAMKMMSLELPHVQEFSLSVSRVNLKTIDFILPMKSLKKFTVEYIKVVSSLVKKLKNGQAKKPEPDAAARDSFGELIKFGNYTNRLYDSNIWTLFPELRKVTIIVVTEMKKINSRANVGRDEAQAEKLVKQRVYTRKGYKDNCRKQ